MFQEMIAEPIVIFHDDGRICLVYKTPTTWKMSTTKADTSDHFVLEVPADYYLFDVATSPNLSALLFLTKEKKEKGWLVRCQHSANTVEIEDAGGVFLVNQITYTNNLLNLVA